MLVNELFNKDINRPINGVVKADQTENDTVFVELDEYVITSELDRHFNHFFEAYMPSVRDPKAKATSGKLGMWISGFFGSGKSHFIKILSYLLQNVEASNGGDSKSATDFFRDKITDAFLIGEIDTAVTKDTTVILFNIDSRANTDDKEDAILKVFLKVFNEQCGFSGDHPHIAHLERDLEERGLYQNFKVEFAALTGSDWLTERDAYDFFRDDMAQALAKVTNQSEESTRAWAEQLENNFPLDIANFCKWVKEYLDVDQNRRIVFFVDEVGQFIGSNTQMMLKLQTITENLGTICEGRAWVVVTSQEDIDSVLGDMQGSKSHDFSKIQGRFERISLSSSNTNEVIEKRLLEKSADAREKLAELYDQKGDILKNQLSFDQTTTAELSNYKDVHSFVQSYPFIPYHYILVQKVFESIRKAGATGLHLSRGERSLLDAFQNAAKQVKDQELGVLIPLYYFYPAIESFLDTSVKKDIDQAAAKDSISLFSVNVLKALFLIRYVDAIKSTLDNLVTLCITKVDDDKLALRKQIEDSLNVLEQNLLIARQGDEYIFLTNEEKEIEAEIQHTDIEASDETNELSNIIFDEVLRRNSAYRYPVNNQDFPVSRFCNGIPKDGSSLNDLVLKFISEADGNYDEYSDAVCMNQSSEGDGCIIVKLPENAYTFKELRTYIRTAKFLRMASSNRPEQTRLLSDKAAENHTRRKRIVTEIEGLIKEAKIFALGSESNPKGSSLQAILDDVYKYVIENSFSKLKLLKPYIGDSITQEIQSVLVADDANQIGLDLNDEGANPQARMEVEGHISLCDDYGRPVTAEDVVQKFSRRPYGWKDEEIVLVLARLALSNKVTFESRQQAVPLRSVYDHLTQIRKRSDLRIRKVKQQSEANLKVAAKLYRDVFSSNAPDSEKELFNQAMERFGRWKISLKDFSSRASTGHFPGKKEIENGLLITSKLLEMKTSFSFIELFIESKNDLLDFEEDLQDLENFYQSQFQTWQKLSAALNQRFERNRKALDKDASAATALVKLEGIYSKDRPYREIRDVEPLIEQVNKVNQKLIDDKREHAKMRLDVRIDRVKAQLEEADVSQSLSNEALSPLQKSKKRIDDQDSLSDINQEIADAAELEEEAYDLINVFIKKQAAEAQKAAQEAENQKKQQAEKEGKKYEIPKTPERAVAEPKVKAVTTIAPSVIFDRLGMSGFIETEEQVEQYLSALRDQLTTAISQNHKIRIK